MTPADIEHLPPWGTYGTKALAELLGKDPIALLMRRYRGRGPSPLPAEWVVGHALLFAISDVRTWLGDKRTATEQHAAALVALGHLQPEETTDAPLVHLMASIEAERTPPIGGRFKSGGLRKYVERIRSL